MPGSVIHPFDVEDPTFINTIRSSGHIGKGLLRSTAAGDSFDLLIESVQPRDDVTFEADRIGGIPGFWVRPVNVRHLVGHIAARAGAAAFIPDYSARHVLLLAALLFGCLAMSSEAQSQALPDVVKLPAGLDLGGSSFYDGFGRSDPGWVFLDFARWNHFTSIRDSNGKSVSLFVDPRIDAFSNLFHIVYVTPLKGSTGAFSVEALLPIVGFDTSFSPRGLALHDNGWSIGDLTLGVDYQTHPVDFGDGSVLSWRAGIDITAPTGSFDHARDLNQGAGFWSIAPYVAVTVLPVPKWEVSVRLSYDYNFSTNRGANVPPIPGFAFHNGEAGQAGWINFASSYEMFDGVRPGINGYWLRQLADDRTNGVGIAHSRVDELDLGPGLSWQVGPEHVVNFNVYLPVSASNTAAGPQFNIQNVIRF